MNQGYCYQSVLEWAVVCYYATLHYIKLHCTSFHFTTLPCTALNYTTLHLTTDHLSSCYKWQWAALSTSRPTDTSRQVASLHYIVQIIVLYLYMLRGGIYIYCASLMINIYCSQHNYKSSSSQNYGNNNTYIGGTSRQDVKRLTKIGFLPSIPWVFLTIYIFLL